MPSQIQLRGQLTDRIKDKSKELLGYEIDQTELRLMPHIMHVMMNNQKLQPEKINAAERKILAKWKKKGYCEGGATGLAISKTFWHILCEIVFLGYVDIDHCSNNTKQKE